MNRINSPSSITPAPETPAYSENLLAAMATFKAAKPWRGTVEERKPKFQTLHTTLCASEGCNWTLSLDYVTAPETTSVMSGLKDDTHELVMIGKLSVVTYLFLFAGAAYGMERGEALAWAQALYRQTFPVSAARMTFTEEGLVLNRADEN
jgi:hypothetical protein